MRLVNSMDWLCGSRQLRSIEKEVHGESAGKSEMSNRVNLSARYGLGGMIGSGGEISELSWGDLRHGHGSGWRN